MLRQHILCISQLLKSHLKPLRRLHKYRPHFKPCPQTRTRTDCPQSLPTLTHAIPTRIPILSTHRKLNSSRCICLGYTQTDTLVLSMYMLRSPSLHLNRYNLV